MENTLYVICTTVLVSVVVWLLNPLAKLLKLVNFLLHGPQANFDLVDNVRPFDEIPGPAGLPYFGCVHRYLKAPGFKQQMNLWKSFFDQYGPVFRQTIMGNTMVVVKDPREIETVFKADGKHPVRPIVNLQAFEDYAKSSNRARGLGVLQGVEWNRVRKALAPKMLRPKDIKENLNSFNTVTRDAIEHLITIRGTQGVEPGEIPDLEGEIAKWATESVGTMAFDLRVGLYDDPPNQETLKMIQATKDAFTCVGKCSKGWEGVLYKFINTPSYRKFCEAEETSLRIGRTFVEKKMADLKRMSDEGGEFVENQAVPLLTYLLSKDQLSLEEIIRNSVGMFRAGIETTSSGLLWLLYELAQNPRVQEKVYEEVTSLVGPHGDFTPESFAKLTYIKACVKEMMRMHPVATGWARVLSQDVVLGGYQVPAGVTVIYSNYLSGRSEELFQDPFEFKPERWLKGENQEEIHPFAIIPFGLGPRMCIGRTIAETEMYLLTAKLVQRFVLEYHHEPVEMITTIVGVPDRPIRIKFVDRQ